MNCENALILISGHIDGENTPEEEALLRAHLEECPDCRAVLRAYEEIDSELTASEEEPPQTLLSGVMETILEQKRETKPRRRFIFGGGTAIAAAVLLLIVGMSGALPDFSQGKASTVDNPTTQQEELTPRSDVPVEPVTSSFELPYNEELLVLVLEDDPADPAEAAIAALSSLICEQAVSGEYTQYWTDAATAREIVSCFEDIYSITIPSGLQEAASDEKCVIRIVQPE